MFTMCSFFNKLFSVTGNNNTIYIVKMGNRNVHSKLPIIVFQINSISLIESEEFRETSNTCRNCTTFEFLTLFSEFGEFSEI